MGKIEISPELPIHRKKYVAIHEVLHACLPDHDEVAIEDISRSIDSFLRKYETEIYT